MFMQTVTTMFLLVAYVSALDVSDIPPQYRALLPSDLKNFLENLSPEEQAALINSFKESNLPIEERLFVAAIKKESPRLGEMIENVLVNWRSRIAALQPEAQEFANLIWDNGVKMVTQVVAGSKPSNAQLQMVLSSILSRYNSLSSFAKADFQHQFPILSSALTGLTLLPTFNPNPNLRSFPIPTGFLGLIRPRRSQLEASTL
ncbi:unnamed protein product [Cylicocyclus nassatus]|uniref:Fatty-acid and retinol-binding protein 1 n=1 Tax=Cylicocyclus nassatus TaxID=53992 RepID=A0AA36GUQ6_CYLNA|nr:unnamed protein product [Cylicocyclus nassatus]